MKKFFLLILIAASIAACDQIETPVKSSGNNTNPNPTPSDTIFSTVLLEDYTGHTCGNCPAAATEADRIKDRYGKKVIILAVHAGFFAEPESNNKYNKDFRTPEGEIYYNTFGVITNPIGMVNRVFKDATTRLFQPGQWEQKVIEQLGKSPRVYVKANASFNNATREINLTVNTTLLTNFDTTLTMVAMLSEDKIFGYQKDYTKPPGSQDVANYEFKHVHRGNLNTAWGDDLFTGSATANEKFTRDINYTLPANIKAADTHIVIAVYNKTTKEIVHTHEIKLIP